jgi:hypothetical protein
MKALPLLSFEKKDERGKILIMRKDARSYD